MKILHVNDTYTPFGLVALESMACGTPVVAVSEGGVRETVVPGETGLLVERDPDGFASALIALLGNPARRDEMGRKGVAHVSSAWTWETSVRRMEMLLESARDGAANG